MTTKLWVREVKKGHILRDTTEPCTHENWEHALSVACQRLDLEKPLVLEKHLRDFDSFSLTHFLPEHFMESVPFDRLEVEFFDSEKKKSTFNEKYL